MTVNLRNVDLNLLTVFDAVMRDGSLSTAARSLGMTQPAVSNAVARLRETFDDSLFVRGRYGMSPTPRATELSGPIREALEILQTTFDSSLAFDPARSQRTFHLAMGDYGELVLLPALLRRIRACGSGLSIRTHPDNDPETLDRLLRGVVDIAFDYRVADDERLEARRLGEEDVVVVAREGNPHVGRRLTKKGYLEASHVVLAQSDGRRTMLESLWNQHDSIPRKVAARVGHFAAMPGLVAQSDCLATLPKRMAEQAVRRWPLAVHRLPFASGRVATYMIWHRSRERDKGHAWLRETILDLSAPVRPRPDPGARRRPR